MEELDQWLDTNLSEPQRQLTQMARRLSRALQKARRGFDLGDLSALRQGLQEVEGTSRGLPEFAASVRNRAEAFDIQQFLRERFDADLRRACADANLPVEGTYPTYVVPPVTLRVDLRAGRVRLNRRLLGGLRIARIVRAITVERDRITTRPFNARQFLRELGAAYDDLVALEPARQMVHVSGIERRLKQIYQRLTPRREWRTQYPEAFFAYDLHRLLSSDELYLADGRRYYLTQSRKSNWTILDRSGREVQYGVIAFRKE